MSLNKIKYFIEIYKKHIIGIFLIIILGILLFYMFKPEQIELDENFDYSVEPESWIREDDDTTIIDVSQATKGNAQHVYSQQRYIDTDGSILTLFYEGNYLGQAFKRVYYDENNEAKMRIYPEMNPNDDVIDSFVLSYRRRARAALRARDVWRRRRQARAGIPPHSSRQRSRA